MKLRFFFTTTLCALCAYGLRAQLINFEFAQDLEEVSNSSIAFADVDGDNDQDVLITGVSPYGIRSKLYQNDGTGNFTEVSGAPFTGVNGGSIAFSDIDSDNDLDVLITGQSSAGRVSKLYQNDGTGNYSEVTGTPFVGVSLGSIAFADVDGDGDQDVLITGNNNAKLYHNDGTGNYSEVSGTPFDPVYNSSIAFADVDNDNDQDVVITGLSSAGSNIAKLYQNNGAGNYSEVSGTPFEGVYHGSIAFTDVDGDSDQDVLITGFEGSENISKLYTNDGTGNYSEVSDTPFEGVYFGSIAFADVDGDNDQDVLITGQDNSNIYAAKLYRNDGFGNYTEVSVTSFSGVRHSSIAFADVDGDNDQDVLVTGATSSDRISTLYLNKTCKGQVDISTIRPACAGESDGAIEVQVTNGVAPLEYRLGGGSFQSSNTFSGLSAGSYQIEVREGGDCSQSFTVVIEDPEPLSMELILSNSSCFNDSDGSITVNASGGTGTIIYSLDGVNYQNENTFSGLTSGDYTVTIMDEYDCLISQETTITEPSELSLALAVTDLTCFDDQSGVITVTTSGGTGTINYSLDGINFQTDNVFTELAAGDYTVTIKDENNCTQSQTVSIAQPAAINLSLNIEDLTCANDQKGTITAIATEGIGIFSYSIDGTSFQAENVFSDLDAGDYTITVKDENGCTATAPATLVESITTETTQPHCNGMQNGSIEVNVINGVAPLSYSIDGGTFQASSTFSDLSAGNYEVQVQDGDNCISTLSVVLEEPQILTLDVTTTDLTCFNDQSGAITFIASGGTGALSYSLDGIHFQSENTFSGLDAGSYIATVKDENDCEQTLSTIEIVSPAEIAVSVTQNNVRTFTVTAASGNEPYQYSLDNETYQSSSVFENVEPGTVVFYAKDTNGCIGFSEEVEVVLGIQDEDFQMYPNPVSDRLIFNHAKELGIGVRSLDGRLIMQRTVRESLDVKELASGTYLIQISDAGEVTTYRFIKAN